MASLGLVADYSSSDSDSSDTEKGDAGDDNIGYVGFGCYIGKRQAFK